jgi:hypothetical protein
MTCCVSYRTGGTTVMRMLRTREVAIDVAYQFLDLGHHDSLEVGPMRGFRERNVLHEADVRRVQRDRMSSPTAMTAPSRYRS